MKQITAARKMMDSKFNPTDSKKKANVKVVIEGPAFFDFKHGQIGHAKNFVEIHPILSLKFK